MAKIVYNACFGGFSVSRAGVLLGRKLSGNPEWGGPCVKGDTWSDGSPIPHDYGGRDIDRNDPILVAVVEQLGDAANGDCAKLRIEDLPDGTLYRIDEYDGNESVVTPDGYEWKTA